MPGQRGGDKKRYHIIASGRVQGVGFRWFCRICAEENGITGYAKNLPDGNVELELQGSEADLYRCIDKIKKGSHFIMVYGLDINEIPVDMHESGFETC